MRTSPPAFASASPRATDRTGVPNEADDRDAPPGFAVLAERIIDRGPVGGIGLNGLALGIRDVPCPCARDRYTILPRLPLAGLFDESVHIRLVVVIVGFRGNVNGHSHARGYRQILAIDLNIGPRNSDRRGNDQVRSLNRHVVSGGNRLEVRSCRSRNVLAANNQRVSLAL
jgi:hypothetical protein